MEGNARQKVAASTIMLVTQMGTSPRTISTISTTGIEASTTKRTTMTTTQDESTEDETSNDARSASSQIKGTQNQR